LPEPLAAEYAALDLSRPQGPWNPVNGHDFTCRCKECDVFWNTPLGTTVHGWYQITARELGDR
jgi:hypothetical protein